MVFDLEGKGIQIILRSGTPEWLTSQYFRQIFKKNAVLLKLISLDKMSIT
jgi:hypothetical protein